MGSRNIGYRIQWYVTFSNYLIFSKKFEGEHDVNTQFTYKHQTEVNDASCAAMLNNEMWIFGGRNNPRQVNFELFDIRERQIIIKYKYLK